MSIYFIPSDDSPPCQGDIFKLVPYWRPHNNPDWPNVNIRGGFKMDYQLFDYAVLLTQTCDIHSAKDYLFVVLENAEALVRNLKESQGNPITESEFRTWIVNNLHPRFHFLERYEHNGAEIIPELVANFRRVFTLRAEYVIKKLMPDGHRLISMHDCYRAELGNRFGHFFSRVATEKNMESA